MHRLSPALRLLLFAAALLLVLRAGVLQGAGVAPDLPAEVEIYSVAEQALVKVPTVKRSEEEWRAVLAPLSFEVTRHADTEVAGTGKLEKEKREGIYRCICCGTDLFLSSAKFESGTGWPSFFAPVHEKNVGTTTDRAYGMVRTEVHCARCGAHLGHVFPDGPEPTGLRYCMNSASLAFTPMALPPTPPPTPLP